MKNPVAPANQSTRFVAHLGMMMYAPQNTMPAFELASRCGFWGCVINTGITRDGEIVVLHDATIDATSNGTGKIEDMTLEEVRQYDFGSWFNELFTGTQIPLLEDVLKLFSRSGVHPVIRLSSQFDNHEDAPTKLYEIVKKHGFLRNITLKGFSITGLTIMFNIFGTKARYGYYCRDISQANIDFMFGLGKDSILDLRYNFITKENMALALQNEIKVTSWIVNDFESMRRLQEMGVSEFTTDTLCLDGCMY